MLDGRQLRGRVALAAARSNAAIAEEREAASQCELRLNENPHFALAGRGTNYGNSAPNGAAASATSATLRTGWPRNELLQERAECCGRQCHPAEATARPGCS